MSVKLGKKTEVGFKKYVGFFEGEVVAVNPDQSQLAGIGINTDKEPEYLKDVDVEIKDKDGEVIKTITVKQLSLVFYIKDMRSDLLSSVRIFLKDVERQNKEKTKWQWVTNQGKTGWGATEKDIPPHVTQFSSSIVKAHEGEADMYEFLYKWLNQADWAKDAEFYFDWKTLMKGDVREIAKLMQTDIAGTLFCQATVKRTDEGKEYQGIAFKGLSYGDLIKQVRVKKFLDQTFVDQAWADKKEIDEFKKDPKNKDKKANKKLTSLQKSVIEITDKEYGVGRDSFYYLGILKEYVPSDDFTASDEVVAGDEGEADDLPY